MQRTVTSILRLADKQDSVAPVHIPGAVGRMDATPVLKKAAVSRTRRVTVVQQEQQANVGYEQYSVLTS